MNRTEILAEIEKQVSDASVCDVPGELGGVWIFDHAVLAVTVPNCRPARFMIMRSAPVWISECPVRTS